MDIALGPADRAFRDEVRAFLAAELPADLRRKGEIMAECTREEVLRWFRILSAQGWIAPTWPKSAGGAGWSIMQRLIFDVETNTGGAPRYTNFGVSMAGPALMHYGTDAQKARYLPKIVASEELWCQGYSEPGAGSDLASLATRAERKGDRYVVDGSKIWTTQAHWADRMFCLVRTDPTVQKQRGITFLLVDMKAKGVTVRPIPRLSGVHEFNQVYLDGVEVPVEDRVGEEGQGWTIAKHVLGHERIGVGGFGHLSRFAGMLRRIAGTERTDGGRLIDDPDFRRRVNDLEVQALNVIQTGLIMLAGVQADEELGYEVSRLKLVSTRVQYELSELMVDAVGYYALPHSIAALLNGWGNGEPVGPPYAVGLLPNFLDWRKMRIGGGGSDEISRNIIAKQTLGL